MALVLLGLAIAVALVTFVVVRVDGPRSLGTQSEQCFRASDVGVSAGLPALARLRFHPKLAYFATFRDPVKRKLQAGEGTIEATRGLVVFEPTSAQRKAAEQEYLDGLAHAPGLSRQVETAARAHLEAHGDAFVQWNPAPLPHSSDRRIANACLGPITS